MTSLEKRKQGFNNWLIRENILDGYASSNINANLQVADSFFNNQLFAEATPVTIRSKASDILRQGKQELSFRDYLSVVQLLLSYAEYIEFEALLNELEVTERDKRKDSLIVAYYFSRTNKVGIKQLGFTSFKNAFQRVAELFAQKPTTIKNMRDEFDPFFENGRAGWYQREISPSRKEVLDQFANVSDESLTAVVRYIISSYEAPVAEPPKRTNHKTIRIHSTHMREIKSK